MGKFKGAYKTEVRVYDDVNDTENSDYEIAFPITVPEAVVFPDSKTLDDKIEDIEKMTGPKGDKGDKGDPGKSATVTVALGDAGYVEGDANIFIPAGTTNCITQLNAALAAIPTGGGEIVLFNGTYNYGSPWVIERNNIKIRGMGASTVLNMEGGRNTNTNAANAKSNNAAIYMSGNNNKISDLSIITFSTLGLILTGVGYGIYLSSSSNNQINGVVVSNSSNVNGCYGIYLASKSSGNNISKNIIKNDATSGNSIGIWVEGKSSDNIINENYINNTASTTTTSHLVYGIYMLDSYNCFSIIANNIFASSCKGSGKCYGINLEPSSSSAGQLVITGNVFKNTGDANVFGISHNEWNLNYVERVAITNNQFYCVAGGICYGINLYCNANSGDVVYVTNHIISNNIFENKATGTANCYAIYICPTNNTIIISENIFRNSKTTQTATTVYALYFAGAGSYNQITNNNFTGVTKAATPGSAYTTNGTSASTLPGTPTTVVSFGTDGICGFNVV